MKALRRWVERNLSALAKAGRLDRAFEVDGAIHDVSEVLAAGRIPILTGDAGIGKTTIERYAATALADTIVRVNPPAGSRIKLVVRGRSIRADVVRGAGMVVRSLPQRAAPRREPTQVA